MPFLLLAAVSLLAVLLYNAVAVRKHQKLPPGCKPIPGPPGLPLLGNLHQIPNDYPWRKFKEWSDIHGPIMEVKLGKGSLIVLSNNDTAKELLERRGQNYSSRPQTYMACEVLSGNLRPLLMPYGDRWRRVRKFIHQMTMPAKALSYQPRQDRESRKLLYDLLQEPEDFARHYYRYASGLVMGLTYDMPVITGKEEYIKNIVQVNDTLEHTAKPGAFLVDSIPVLKFMPSFMAPFKRLGKAAHEFEYALFTNLLQDIKNKLNRGSSVGDCFAKDFLKKGEKKDLTDDEGAYACGTMFEAGSGTTSGALEILTMALLLFPEVQVKAQKELDDICGDRLPQFEDERDLPYIKAVAKEALRWRPIVTQGILHMSVKDDRYGDYFIPANTPIVGNHWAIHMDPDMYPEPDRFNPGRFIDPSFPTAQSTDGVEYGASRGHWAFGFGRRACPGQHIGEYSLFILTARLLWAFNFRKYVTPDGHVQEPDPLAFTTGQ
ncbi:uncharacterized protein N7477_010268 [Penicillium maclennaniae]|uniref:uncharacterized protein n=1 Tax=Penicillium maclennaniae TaxID=1343394 RepID=UPI00253F681A|nr:uncharacterized protein N7477_010268 [Penicillium maclennaniae]KAJ5662652.1 hypothetical protein N7477_010268 [Penicillium maclennaniae]